MSVSADEIRTLCDNWCNAARKPEGGFAISGETEKYRLLANGVHFHELDFDELMASITGLSKVLLLPGLNTVVVQDHFALWSWSAEILLSRHTNFFTHEEHEVRSLFETCVRASLANCRKPPSGKEEWERQNKIQEQLPHHARYFLLNSALVLAYLGFPLLESITKRICSNFVQMDGTVIAPFQVLNKIGNVKEYDPNGRFNQKQCANLRDLLFLLYDQIADPDLKRLLSEFRQHISSLDSTEDPFDIIYKWRNQSLHGTTNFQTIGGTLLNLTSLICIYQLRDNYSDLRVKVLEQCRWESQHEHKSPWSFYPPY